MVGHDRGFVSLLKKKLTGQPVIDYHCIIHQEVLCAKLKHGELNNLLKLAVKIVNFICAKALNHRLFKAMLQDSEAEYTDLLMHTEVRWLSKGKALERFIALLPEIEHFANSRGQTFPKLKDVKWLLMLHFLSDLFAQFNALNLMLQGKQQLVWSMMNGIYSFESKLVLFKEQLDVADFTHFPKLLAVTHRFPNAQEMLPTLNLGACLEAISGEIKRQFSQFRTFTPLFRLVQNPWMVSARNLDAVELIVVKRPQAQMELIDMQLNSALEASFLGQAPEEFWNTVPSDKFPVLFTVAQKIICIFEEPFLNNERLVKTMFKPIKVLFTGRLSDNAAPDSPELRTQLFVCDVDEGLASFQGNEDPGTHLGNPDIRVPKNTKREDGLGARRAGEEEEDEQNADREQQETGDKRKVGNEVPPKTTGHPGKKKEVEPRALRHVAGGTWLPKCAEMERNIMKLWTWQ
ncbi:hypothetical protein NDU88_005073 [Pleurodeles waltl]|uniref:Uncharacterized protein n=1 Tax=Pleurodeles waltl TaxID=8319 RepID=A0AAV7MWZ3_PLEWA|nr:hypothetical protein NDU88_005073 [Pleurodeles waltl]